MIMMIIMMMTMLIIMKRINNEHYLGNLTIEQLPD